MHGDDCAKLYTPTAQVEIQMLAASAWIAQAKGREGDGAEDYARRVADLEDHCEKHIAMENRGTLRGELGRVPVN